MRETGIAVLLTLICGAASAQEAVPPPDVGVGYGALLVREKGGDYTIGSSQPSINLRVTLPFTPRFAFEAFATISNSTSDSGLHRTDGLYVLEVKQRLVGAAGGRFHAFLTYGGAGYYARLRQEAFTGTRPDGSSFSIVEYSYNHTDPPFFAVFGGGLQQEIGHRVALRTDVQMVTLLWVPFGVRLSAGVSLPLGTSDVMQP
jgi:hypothetical protein